MICFFVVIFDSIDVGYVRMVNNWTCWIGHESLGCTERNRGTVAGSEVNCLTDKES